LSCVRLTIDSDLDDVVLITTAIHTLCAEVGLNEVEAYQIELCACEAVTNVIRHGYHGEHGHEISVGILVSEDRLDLEISDKGTPMSAEHVEKLIRGPAQLEIDPADIASLKEGGRGLQIIHAVMDEISYVIERGVNRLLLTRLFRTRQDNGKENTT
jgi:serine/threonine-protein kinase RsbW